MSFENPKKSVKQRLISLQGQKAPIDLYLFACWEQENTLKALSQPPKSKTKQRTFLAPLPRGWNLNLDNPTIEKSEDGFLSAWKLCCKWYQSEYPDLFTDAIFDHERLARFVLPTVDLVHDLIRIHHHCYGGELPPFPVSPVGEPTASAHPLWLPIVNTMTELFHSSAQWVIQYLGWCFREEIEEVFEPGSRPPVGRYAPPPPRRESFYGAKGGRSREGERKGGSRERSQGPARKESFRDNPRKTQKHEQKPPRGSSSAAEFRKNSRKPKTGDEMTQRQTETVLQEVEKALETLRRQPDIQEIRLAPQNSFYRRIQHQKIVDAGFISQSVGEGSDRAVTIQRQ